MFLTTRVDKTNLEFFKSYIPPGIYSKLSRQNVLAIGAVEDTTAIGVMVVEIKDKAVMILWVFVADDYRRRGVASMLFVELENAAIADNLTEIRTAFSEEDNAEIMTALLEKHEYICAPIPSSGIYTIKLADVKWSVLEKARTNEQLMTWADVPNVLLRVYGSKLAKEKEITVDLPLIKDDYLPYSMAAVQSGEITGVCLYKPVSDTRAELNFLRGNTASLGVMLRSSLEAIKAEYPVDVRISMSGADGSGLKLLRGLVGEVETSGAVVGLKIQMGEGN